jgi:hypothetical protein
MSKTSSAKRFGFWGPILLLVGILGLFKVFGPMLTDIPQATVHLEGCEGEHCVLSGHLSQQAFTGHYVLTKSDGTQLIFSPDAVGIMSWPAPTE